MTNSTSGEQTSRRPICFIGDVHGHLQLGLCLAARWQRELNIAFEAVFLCGDVGAFTADEQLDSTTRRHGKANPSELEFLLQWSADPQPPWLIKIFEPIDVGGLGLLCPVVMIHGNHEGFQHLATLVPAVIPPEPVPLLALPAVERSGRIRFLPSGWRCITDSLRVIAGVGGVEEERYAVYHPMAKLDQSAVMHLLEQPPVDVLVTHQGPSSLQGDEKGSATLQTLLDEERMRFWFHGHSTPNPAITACGPNARTLVVPLEHTAFSSKGKTAGEPGDDGWAYISGDDEQVHRGRPNSWRDYRRSKWTAADEYGLVSPDLARWIR